MKTKSIEFVKNKYDEYVNYSCRECCSDCSGKDESCPDCPLETTGTCEKCMFNNGHKNKLREVWDNLIEICKSIKNDYIAYCELMNECAVNYIKPSNSITVIILDDIITKCECELNNIKYLMNISLTEEVILPEIHTKIESKEMKMFDSYLLYSDYIDRLNDIIDELIKLEYDMIVPVITREISYLTRFVTSFYQISRIIGNYINSNRIEVTKKVECEPDYIEKLEIKIMTDKEEINNFISGKGYRFDITKREDVL